MTPPSWVDDPDMWLDAVNEVRECLGEAPLDRWTYRLVTAGPGTWIPFPEADRVLARWNTPPHPAVGYVDL